MMKHSLDIHDSETLYRAHRTRDYRFDGKFFVAVKTTNIYCRPICPARKAKLENVTFYLKAHEAEAAGYRPCMRCRPESAPGSPAWIGTSATVRRAIRLMETSHINALSITALAEQLGVGTRWLRELFQNEMRISPQAYLSNRKLSLARNLLDTSTLSITDIAFHAGFQSVRRFNDAFKKKFGQSPSYFKSRTASLPSQTLYFNYRPPLDWPMLLNFFRQRAIPSMEHVDDHRYTRLIRYQDTKGWITLSHGDGYTIRVDFHLEKPTSLLPFNLKIREMLDLDADPMLIEQDLKQDTKLKKIIEAHPGIRVPGAWDCFEIAVRAIIGQKISVKAAKTVLARLVATCGERQILDANLKLTHFFPTPQSIMQTDLSALGLTQAKMHTLKSLAQAIIDGHVVLDGTQDDDKTYQSLLAIKGIGPWTAQYIAMRGLRNPDAFPEKDLELLKKIEQYGLNPELWRPWRAYVASLFFSM